MRRVGLAAVGLAAGFVAAVSTAKAAGVGFEIVRDHVDYNVSADGSYVEKQQKIFRIISPKGLDALHEVVLSYTEEYQDAGIDEAYTIKPDGRRIDVPQDKMFLGYGLTTSPGFRDQKTKVAVFENVEVGDEVGYVTVFRQKKPWYPGQFFSSFALGPRVPLHDFEVTVTAPVSLALKTDANGLTGGRTRDTDSHQHWLWKFENPAALAPEDASVTGFDEGAYLVVSTLPDFAALARSYEDGARGKAVPTDDIKALAEKITAGTTDRREITRKLYEWVSDNIKYVAIVLGNGGLVPHVAADVLQSRYGDCKDHVTLLEALLAAKGIQSSPALINLDSTYFLPNVASPELFNHLISYVPEFDLFLDSTAKGVPFGVLPPSDMDKPVLLTSLETLKRTPTETAAASTLHTVSNVTVHADGSAEADTRFEVTGPLAVGLRSKLADPDSEERYLRDTVPGVIGGTVIADSSANTTDPYSGAAHYRIENAANLAGPGAISFGFAYRPQSPQSLMDAVPPERHEPYVCPSFTDRDQTTIRFPRGVVIRSVPKRAEATFDGLTFRATYDRLPGNAVKAEVVLQAEHPHMVCSADYYNRVRGALGRVMGLLGAQVIYAPTTAMTRDVSTARD